MNAVKRSRTCCHTVPCACAATAAPREATTLDDGMDAVLKALASAPRRQMLRIISAHTPADGGCCGDDVCACDLSDALELAPSTISHHMTVLVKAGLVTATKRGLWVYYRIERDALAAVASNLGTM